MGGQKWETPFSGEKKQHCVMLGVENEIRLWSIGGKYNTLWAYPARLDREEMENRHHRRGQEDSGAHCPWIGKFRYTLLLGPCGHTAQKWLHVRHGEVMFPSPMDDILATGQMSPLSRCREMPQSTWCSNYCLLHYITDTVVTGYKVEYIRHGSENTFQLSLSI